MSAPRLPLALKFGLALFAVVAGGLVIVYLAVVPRLESRLVFKSRQTIAGQTAPGGGIVVYGDGTSFSGADNTIVRYLRFRMGRGGESEKDTVTIANGHDLIFDHVSLSWGRDGNFDLNRESGEELYAITLQDSIVAQGLQTPTDVELRLGHHVAQYRRAD